MREPVLFYNSLGCSPQGYKDWLMCSCSIARRSKCGKIYSAALKLIRLSRRSDDFKSDDERREECEAAEYLSRVKHDVYVPPVALGSKRSSMPFRFKAHVHGVRLISQNWAMCCRLVASTFTLVSDLGPEKLLPRFPSVPVSRLFPWTKDADSGPAAAAPAPVIFDDGSDEASTAAAGHSADKSADADDDTDSDGGSACSSEHSESSSDGAGSDSDDDVLPAADAEDPMVSMDKALHISGPQHVIHNATEDFKTVMELWSPFIHQLGNLCRLLTRPWSRDRYFETCLSQAEIDWFEPGPASIFQRFSF